MAHGSSGLFTQKHSFLQYHMYTLLQLANSVAPIAKLHQYARIHTKRFTLLVLLN